MQFVCNSCKAKYTISADRVRGRVLKIRCRECGKIIEVRGDGLAGDDLLRDGGGRKKAQSSKDLSENYKLSSLRDRFKESFTAKGAGKLPDAAPPPGSQKPAKQETSDPRRWYVSVRNQPVGPVSKMKVKGYLRRKEVDGSSLVWREGFDDWKPLQSCAELSDLLEEMQPKRQETDTAAAAAAAETPAPRPEAPDEPSPDRAAADDDALRGYHLGRIDAQATVAEMASAEQKLEHDVFKPVPQATRTRKTPLQRFLHSRLALVSGGALAVLLGFGVTLLVMGLTQKEPTPVAQEPEVVEDMVFEKDHSERGDILAGLTISLEEVISEELKAEKEAEEQAETKKSGGGGSRAKVKKGSSGGDKDDFAGLPSNMPFGIKEKTVSSSSKKVGSSSGSKKGQNGLSDSQIRSVVTKNSKTIRKCYEKVLGKGIGVKEDIKVKVRVNVGTSGMVKSAKVTKISNFGNFLTPCIEKSIKGWVFPRAGQASEFVFPILLTPKH